MPEAPLGDFSKVYRIGIAARCNTQQHTTTHRNTPEAQLDKFPKT